MRVASLVSFLSLSAFALAVPASGKSADAAGSIQPLQQQFQEAFTRRDWPAAAAALKNILAIQDRTGPEDPATIETLTSLGIALQLSGKPGEAEPIFRRELASRKKREGENAPAVARAYNSVALSIEQQNRFADAEPFYRSALASHAASKGASSPEAAFARQALANNLVGQGKLAEAVRESEAARDITVARAGADSMDAAGSYDLLGKMYVNIGRFADAEAQHRRSLAIRDRNPKEQPELRVASQNGLALALTQQGKYGEAEPLLRRALADRRAAYGAKDPFAADILSNLATTIQNGGNATAAEPMLREALAIRTEISGPDHPSTLTAMTNLSTCLNDLGRYAEAETFARKAFDGRLRLQGENHPQTAIAAGNLAGNLASLGRDVEAEAYYRRAVAIMRATGGEEHPDTATAYSNLASSVATQGRYAEAEELQRRALGIRRKVLAPDNPDIADNLQNLGYVLGQATKYADADAPLREALALTRKRSGPGSAATARALNNLASNLDNLGRGKEAAPLYAQSYKIRVQTLGREHPLTMNSLNNLAYSRFQQGDKAGAITRFREVVDVQRRAYGPNNPARVVSLNNLAMVMAENKQGVDGLVPAREATRIAALRRAAIIGGNAAGDDQIARAQVRARSDELLRNDPLVTAYIGLTQLDWAAAAERPAMTDALRAEAFVAAQQIDLSKAGLAMARTAARTAAGGGPLGDLVARQQRLTDQLAELDMAYSNAVARGDSATTQRITGESATLARQLAEVDAEIDRAFPNYRALIAPTPIDLADVQKRLQPGEGLLMIMPSNGDMFSFAISRDRVAWNRVARRQESMNGDVAKLLCQVDPVTCAAPEPPATPFARDGYPMFDRAAAFGLYRDLVQPVEGALEGVKTLYVTTGGKLSAISLDMLVTQAPPVGDDADPAILARTPWLADRYALVTLPSASLLRGLDRQAASGGRKAFVGYGAPTLAGASQSAGPSRGVRPSTDPVFRATGQGAAMADQALLKSLEPLPGTRRELTAMATALSAPASSLKLGNAATEVSLKRDRSIGETRVLAIATHGLLPRELGKYDEPGLVFTPPKQPTAEDDGVLSASEAAQLRLDADWVILSACNTAGGESGAESLSGLARAFLYAGARSLLASHWRVSDDATAVLTVETLRADETLSRAAALQAGARAVRTGRRADGSAVANWDASWAHPMLWAPFSLVSIQDE